MNMARLTRNAALALLLAAPAVSGCVAAALPVIAAGGIARNKLTDRHHKKDKDQRAAPAAQPAGAEPAAVVPPFKVVGVVQGGMPVPGGPPPVVTAPGAPPEAPKAPPPGMQYLYGSGEGAAISMQAYQALWMYLSARAVDRKAGLDIRGVVLGKDATLEVPKFMSCGKKPLAAVFDVDETVLLNLGYEYSDATRTGPYDEARWQRWEKTGADKVAAVPGAVEALDAARRAGITIVFNTNRSAGSAAETAAAIEGAGLGKAELGKTLWLRADGAPSGKDGRRWEIAAKYCVVALVGDQLGDFSDLFNPGGVPVPIRRNMTTQTMIASMWGAGWFVLPNPVYGTALHGDLDDLFPADKRWTDPAEEQH
jgi:5'-nucleotidase (lipoprotein e(P4) family)